MNKAFIGAGIALALTLAGCNRSQGVFPVGVPTIDVEKNESITKVTTPGANGAPPTNVYTWTVNLNVYTRPGSPSGRLIGLRVNTGLTFSAPKVVKNCAVTEKNSCPNGTVTFKGDYENLSDIPSYTVVGLVVAGDNDIDAVVYTTPFDIGR